MGIKVGTGGGNVQFFGINMKEGCFFQGSGESRVKYEPGKAVLEGVPYRLSMQEDTYENQKSIKANLYLRDPEGGPNMAVSWTIYTEAHEASSQGVQMLARLFAADTTKAVQIRPWFAEAGLTLGNVTFDNDGGHISFKQQDQTGAWVVVKPDFAGRGDKLPPMEERKIEGTNKTIKVKPGWTEIMEDLAGRLITRLEAENPRTGQTQAPSTPAAGAEEIDPADLAAAANEQAGMRQRA